MIESLRREIEETHAFIAAWFRGDVEQDDTLFAEQFAQRLDASLVNVQPLGKTLTRAELVDGIRAGYGGNPNFHIDIEEVTLRFAEADLALVTYVEFQRGAKNTVPADNRRVSSVWFRGVQARRKLTWLHIHETALAP